MVEDTFIWKKIWKNQEALLTFLRGQDARYGSSESRAALNKIAPLIITASIVKKNKIKNVYFAFFKGYTRGISPISIINAPKWRRSAEMEILKFNVFEYRGVFRLNSANCKKNINLKANT